MTEQEIINNLKAYGKSIKSGIPRLLTESTMRALNEQLGKNENEIQNKDLKELVGKIKKFPANDFSKLESLSSGMIAIMSSKAYYDAKAAGMLDNETRYLDPFYRRGLEMASTTHFLSADEQEQAQQLNDKMAELVLSNTLAPVKGDALTAVQNQYGEKADKQLNTNRLEQLTIAKTMLLTHLGSMHIMQKDGRNVPYIGSVADSMAHGGRTAFFLPKGDAKDSELTQKFFFNDQHTQQVGEEKNIVDNGTAVEWRFAASHSMETGKTDEGAGAYKESSDHAFRNNYQMNPAIGGFGKQFGNKPILNDGLNGQMFLQMQTSTEKKGGYLMVGFENEKSGAVGRTGHHHSMLATEANFSSLMGGKGGPGAKKGGRVVDLSMYSTGQLNTILDKFNESYSKLQNDAVTNPDAERKLNEVNRALCGKIMSPDAVLDMMENKLSINKHMTSMEEVTVEVDGGYRKERMECSFNLHNVLHEKDSLSQYEFQKLNDKAESKLGEKRQKLGVAEIKKIKEGEELFTPQPGMQKLLNGLLKAKKNALDFTKESDKMKKIKLQLSDLTDAWTKGELSKEEAKKVLSAICDSTSSYIQDPSKNQTNARMKAVKSVYSYAHAELKNLGIERENILEQPQAGQPKPAQMRSSEPPKQSGPMI